MGGNNCWHCGVPLQRAAKYIGIVDVVFGLIGTVILSIHVSEVYDYSSAYYSSNYKSYYNRSFPGLTNFPRELTVVLLVASATQLVMGVVLYIGAANKSRSICQFWLVTTGLTALFTGILLRLWEMFVVNEFSRELREEQEVTYFTGQTQLPGGQQIPPYVQHNPTDKYQNQGLGVMGPPPLGPSVIDGSASGGGGGGGNGYSQFYNQPQQAQVVASPVANMYGVQVHGGNGSQYPTQLAYNPGSQVQSPQVPAALQPPPRYDALEGVSVGGYNNGGYGGGSAGGVYGGSTPGGGEESKGFTYTKY